MRKIYLGVAVILFIVVGTGGVAMAQAMAGEGLVTVGSVHSVEETTNRLQSALQERGLIVVARVDHAANAQRAGKELRPTQLLIFGNPALGTELMQASQASGIDLPQKLLVWEDDRGQVHVTYNDPRYLARRHGIEGQESVLTMISNALDGLARSAAAGLK